MEAFDLAVRLRAAGLVFFTVVPVSAHARCQSPYLKLAPFVGDHPLTADPERATAVCARVGSGDFLVDIGCLIHSVWATPSGCEMRSRFWMGGRHIGLQSGALQAVGRAVRPLVNRSFETTPRSAQELLVHCAQEMNHLAARLPDLHRRFDQQ